VLKPAQATPAMISKAWACLRTSIFFRQSDAMTNVRADLMASRHCIFASPAQLASRSIRAWQCKRRSRLTESVASFRTSCSEVACEVQPKTRLSRSSLTFKSGHKWAENWTVSTITRAGRRQRRCAERSFSPVGSSPSLLASVRPASRTPTQRNDRTAIRKRA
jgi:hypothetical protein